MGAEGNTVDEVDDDSVLNLVDVLDKLDSGYVLVADPSGQLRLIAPSPSDPLDAGPGAA